MSYSEYIQVLIIVHMHIFSNFQQFMCPLDTWSNASNPWKQTISNLITYALYFSLLAYVVTQTFSGIFTDRRRNSIKTGYICLHYITMLVTTTELVGCYGGLDVSISDRGLEYWEMIDPSTLIIAGCMSWYRKNRVLQKYGSTIQLK